MASSVNLVKRRATKRKVCLSLAASFASAEQQSIMCGHDPTSYVKATASPGTGVTKKFGCVLRWEYKSLAHGFWYVVW